MPCLKPDTPPILAVVSIYLHSLTTDAHSLRLTGSDSSDTFNDPPSPIPQVAQSCLRRRRIRGYTIFSDEEPLSEDYTSDEPDEPIKTSLMDICNEDTLQDNIDNKSSGSSEILAIYTREIQLPNAPWFAASDLPQYIAEDVKVLPSLNLAEQIIASFTVYEEMKDAVLDSHFEKVFHRLQQEWTYVGGLVSLFSSPRSLL